jgi:hypothetical protein
VSADRLLSSGSDSICKQPSSSDRFTTSFTVLASPPLTRKKQAPAAVWPTSMNMIWYPAFALQIVQIDTLSENVAEYIE